MVDTRLRAARKSKGMTQAALADLLGISQPAYFQFESGKRTPNVPMVIKLCRALDVSADYLLGIEAREGSLTKDEAALVNDFRSLDGKWKRIVLETAHAAALSAAEGTDAGEGDAEGIA